MWINFSNRKQFSLETCGSVWCWDYGQGKQYFYSPGTNTITISKLPKGIYGADSALDVVDVFFKYMSEEGVNLSLRKETINGNDVEIFEATRNYPEKNMAFNNTVVKETKITIIAERKNKLILSANVKYLDENNAVFAFTKCEISYPETGPTEIYDIGVPRKAEIIDNQPIN